MRAAIVTSTRSPEAWPKVSLMYLKRSLSRNSTATLPLPMRASRMARSSSASMKARFDRPVRLSWLARCDSEACSFCRWLCHASSSSSRALKSSLIWFSSAMLAGGTRNSNERSRRTRWAVSARWRSGDVISFSMRRDKRTATTRLSTRQASRQDSPLSRKGSKLRLCGTRVMLPMAWSLRMTGKVSESGSIQPVSARSM